MLVLLLALSACDRGGDSAAPLPCVEAYSGFSGKQKRVDVSGCCEGLEQVSESIVVAKGDTPTSKGLPEGCADDGGAPDGLICLPCGDGTCGKEENYCNCAADCTAPGM
jgi:hypothetical protein